eukprot:COSAG02_NODE_2735_length_8131_cov_5.035359_2_plen_336_part_00
MEMTKASSHTPPLGDAPQGDGSDLPVLGESDQLPAIDACDGDAPPGEQRVKNHTRLGADELYLIELEHLRHVRTGRQDYWRDVASKVGPALKAVKGLHRKLNGKDTYGMKLRCKDTLVDDPTVYNDIEKRKKYQPKGTGQTSTQPSSSLATLPLQPAAVQPSPASLSGVAGLVGTAAALGSDNQAAVSPAARMRSKQRKRSHPDDGMPSAPTDADHREGQQRLKKSHASTTTLAVELARGLASTKQELIGSHSAPDSTNAATDRRGRAAVAAEQPVKLSIRARLDALEKNTRPGEASTADFSTRIELLEDMYGIEAAPGANLPVRVTNLEREADG